MTEIKETVLYHPFQSGERKPIANFRAWMVEEKSIENASGEIVERLVLIQGEIGNKLLPRVWVNALDLSKPNWPEQLWGFASGVMVYPLYNAGTHLKTAIRAASSDIRVSRLLRGMGFNDLLGEQVYTTLSGSVSEGPFLGSFSSNLNSPLNLYDVGEPLEELYRTKKALSLALKLLEISSEHGYIGTLLVAIAFRSVLTRFIRTDYITWFVGFSGAFKSSGVAVTLNFFGKAFDDQTMPAYWADSLATLERKTTLVRHAPICIDDYLESGPNANKYVEKGHAIIRTVGDGNASGKMEGTKDIRATEPLTCLVISTAETLPRNLEESAFNRCVICPVLEGEIDSKTLGSLQKHGKAGAYRRLAGTFIRYVIQEGEHLDTVLRELNEQERIAFRDALGTNTHARQPDNFASLMLGILGMLLFAENFNLLPSTRRNAIEKQCRSDLIKLAQSQEKLQKLSFLGEIIVQRLKGAFLESRCYVRIYQNGSKPDLDVERQLGWKNAQCGELHIGWYDLEKKLLYLRVDKSGEVLRFVCGLDQRIDKAIGASQRMLGKILLAEKLLGKREQARDTNSVRITPHGENGGPQSVYAIRFSLD